MRLSDLRDEHEDFFDIAGSLKDWRLTLERLRSNLGFSTRLDGLMAYAAAMPWTAPSDIPLLLEWSSADDLSEPYGRTPPRGALCQALSAGRFDLAESLLSAGANPLSLPDIDYPPLAAAVDGMSRPGADRAVGLRVLSALLDSGCDIDARHASLSPGTALGRAAMHGDGFLCSYLADRGADPLLSDANGRAPADLAAGSALDAMAHLLAPRAPVDAEIASAGLRSLIDEGDSAELARHLKLPDYRRLLLADGGNLLHYAAESGAPAASLTALLEGWVDLRAKDGQGRSPLDIAKSCGNGEAVSALLAAGASEAPGALSPIASRLGERRSRIDPSPDSSAGLSL